MNFYKVQRCSAKWCSLEQGVISEKQARKKRKSFSKWSVDKSSVSLKGITSAHKQHVRLCTDDWTGTFSSLQESVPDSLCHQALPVEETFSFQTEPPKIIYRSFMPNRMCRNSLSDQSTFSLCTHVHTGDVLWSVLSIIAKKSIARCQPHLLLLGCLFLENTKLSKRNTTEMMLLSKPLLDKSPRSKVDSNLWFLQL